MPASGCLCDCTGTYNTLWVGSATPMTSIDVSGNGCGQSYCADSDRDVPGACVGFNVRLVAPGSCHVTGTATDGRQASTDVTVRFLKGSCCGDYYTTDRTEVPLHSGGDTVLLTF